MTLEKFSCVMRQLLDQQTDLEVLVVDQRSGFDSILHGPEDLTHCYRIHNWIEIRDNLDFMKHLQPIPINSVID